jgi:hypothetical protein
MCLSVRIIRLDPSSESHHLRSEPLHPSPLPGALRVFPSLFRRSPHLDRGSLVWGQGAGGRWYAIRRFSYRSLSLDLRVGVNMRELLYHRQDRFLRTCTATLILRLTRSPAVKRLTYVAGTSDSEPSSSLVALIYSNPCWGNAATERAVVDARTNAD